MKKLFYKFRNLFLYKCSYCSATELDSMIYKVPFKQGFNTDACLNCIISLEAMEREEK